MGHPNEDLVRRGYEAFSKGDMQTLSEVMAQDAVHSVPGNHQLSGEYKGQDAVFGYYQQLGVLTDGSFRVELESVQAEGDDRVVTRHRNIGQRGGNSLDVGETLVFTIADGKVARLDEHPDDQAAMDDFFS